MDRRRAAGVLLALAAIVAYATAAPTANNHTSLDLYDGAPEGCYYNFQHYGEGDRIMTNEPCLNCTCHNRMLMCYLRVCPFTKPIGQDCTVEKRADQCCPIVTCPDVPVDLLTSTTTSPAEYGSTGVGHLDKYGCSIHGKYFSEGSKVPPSPNKPCEHCYCIRNMTTCVMQECTLHVDGCTPIYHKDVCCPVRYSCDHPEDEMPLLDDLSTTVRPTPGFLLTTTTQPPVTQMSQDCLYENRIVPDGALIKTEKACDHCYCMKGDIVCVVQECGTPMENEGKNCSALPPREGVCCPDTYICEGDEPTQGPTDENYTTELVQEKLTTLTPPRRAGSEGSGYRNEPDDIPITESPFDFETEGSGDEQSTIHPIVVTEGVPDSHKVDLTDEASPSTEESQEFIPITTAEPVREHTEFTTLEDIEDSDKQHETSTSAILHDSEESTTVHILEEDNGSGDEEILTSQDIVPTSTVLSVKDDSEPTAPSEQEVIATTEYNNQNNAAEPTTYKPAVEKEDEINMPNIATDIPFEQTTHSQQPMDENKTTKMPFAYEDTPSTESDLLKNTDNDSAFEKDERKTTENIVQDTTASYETESKKPFDSHYYSTVSTSAPGYEDEIATESQDMEEGTIADIEPSPHVTVTANTPLLEEIENGTDIEQEYVPVKSTPDREVTSTTVDDILIGETTDKESLKPDVIDETLTMNIPTNEPLHENEDAVTTESQNELDSEQNTGTFEPPRGQGSYEEDSSEPHKYSTTTKSSVIADGIFETTQYAEEISTASEKEHIDNDLSSTTPQQQIEITTAEPDKGLNTIPSGTVEENMTESPDKIDKILPEESTTELDNKFDDEIQAEISKTTTLLPLTSESTDNQSKLTTEPTMQADNRKTTTEETLIADLTTVSDDFIKATILYDHSPSTESFASEHQETSTLAEEAITENVEQTTGSKESSPTLSYQSTTELDAIPEKHETSSPSYETMLETTTQNLQENEIINEPRIPGEGDCLLNGVTYRNESSIPSTNKCQSGCKCVSSIIKCDPIICSEPPAYMDNCQTTYDSPDSCCPTYVCEHKTETMPPQSHSQVSVTEAPVKCHGDKCVNEVQIPTSELCESGKCTDQGDHEKCTGDKCTPPTDQLCNEENGCQVTPVKPCEGNECEIVLDPITPQEEKPCGDSGDCNIPIQECSGQDCTNAADAAETKPQDIEKECTEKSCKRKDDTRDDQQVPQICSGSECQSTKSTSDLELTTTSMAPHKESDLETQIIDDVTTIKPFDDILQSSQTPQVDEYETKSNETSTQITNEAITEPTIQSDIEAVTNKIIEDTDTPQLDDTQLMSTTEHADTLESEKTTITITDENVTGTTVISDSEQVTQSPESQKTELQFSSGTSSSRPETEKPSPSSDSNLLDSDTTPSLPETDTELTTQPIITELTSESEEHSKSSPTYVPQTETSLEIEVTTAILPADVNVPVIEDETEAPASYDLSTKSPTDNDQPSEEEKKSEEPAISNLSTTTPEDEIKYTDKPEEKETEAPLTHDVSTAAPEYDVKYTDKPVEQEKESEATDINVTTPPEDKLDFTDEPLEKQTKEPAIHDITTETPDVIGFTEKHADEENKTEAPESHEVPTSSDNMAEFTDAPLETEKETEAPAVITEAPEDAVKYTNKTVEIEDETEEPVSHDLSTETPVEVQYTDKPLDEEQETNEPIISDFSTAAPEIESKYTNKPQTFEKETEASVTYDDLTVIPEHEEYTDKPTEEENGTEAPLSIDLNTVLPEDYVTSTDKPAVQETETHDFVTAVPESDIKLTDKPVEIEKATDLPMDHDLNTVLPDDEVKSTDKPTELEKETEAPENHDLNTVITEDELKPTDKPTEDEKKTETPVSYDLNTVMPKDEVLSTDQPAEKEKETEKPVIPDLVTAEPEYGIKYTDEPAEVNKEPDVTSEDEVKYTDEPVEKETEAPISDSVMPDDKIQSTNKPDESENEPENPSVYDSNTDTPEEEVKYTDKPEVVEKETTATILDNLSTSAPEFEVKYTDKLVEDEKVTETPDIHDLSTESPEKRVTIKPDELEKETQTAISYDLSTISPDEEIKMTDEPSIVEKDTEIPTVHNLITEAPNDGVGYTDKSEIEEQETEAPFIHDQKTGAPVNEVIPTDKPVELENETKSSDIDVFITETPEIDVKYSDKPEETENETEVSMTHELITIAPVVEDKYTDQPSEQEKETEKPVANDLITESPQEEVKYPDKTAEVETETNAPEIQAGLTYTSEDEINTDKPTKVEKETGESLDHDLTTKSPQYDDEYTDRPLEDDKETEVPVIYELSTSHPEKQHTEENKETTTSDITVQTEQTTPSIRISETTTEPSASPVFTDKTTESSVSDGMKTEIPFEPTQKEFGNELPVTDGITMESSTSKDGTEDVETTAPEIYQSSTDSHRLSTEGPSEGIEVITEIPAVPESSNTPIPDAQITKDTEVKVTDASTPPQPTATESVQDITETQDQESTPATLSSKTTEVPHGDGSSTQYIEKITDTESTTKQDNYETTTTMRIDEEHKHVSPIDQESTDIPALVTDQQTIEAATESQPALIDTETSDHVTTEEETDKITSPVISETTRSPVEDSEKSTAASEEPIATVETMLTTIKPLLSEEEQPTTSSSKYPEVAVQTEKTETPAEKQPEMPLEEIEPAQTTTPKTEEVYSSVFDKITKPAPKPTPTSTTELPRPIPTEEENLSMPDEEASVPPSGASGYGQEPDYVDEDPTFGPGTCRYGGKVYVSAQQIPRDDPCDFCFCFRSDIICLQQSCPPPIHGCHEEPIQGFCCPRYECPVSMATTVNVTTTTTTTTTTLPPHFPVHSYKGSAQKRGCLIKGHTYKVGEVVRASSGPCLHCTCGGDGQMKCDPKQCTPEPMLRQMIAAAVSAKRRR